VDSAQNAITMFNDFNLDGYVLHVREDREVASGSVSNNQEARIIVANLPFRAEWQELKDMCAPFGNVVRADVDFLNDGRSKGSGTVVFASQADAWACIQGLDGQVVEGRTLGVYAADSGAPAPAQRPRAFNAPAFQRERVFNGSAPASNNQECRLVISGLPFRLEWQELKDLCKPFGNVVRADVDLLADGRSKGCGTVVFSSQAEAWTCIQELNGQMLEGRTLAVKPIVGDAGGAPVSGFKVYVGNLPWSCNWQTLKDMGRPFGDVLFADLALEPSGRPRGFGVLTFAQPNAARSCIASLHGTIFEGRDLTVHEDNRNSF